MLLSSTAEPKAETATSYFSESVTVLAPMLNHVEKALSDKKLIQPKNYLDFLQWTGNVEVIYGLKLWSDKLDFSFKYICYVFTIYLIETPISKTLCKQSRSRSGSTFKSFLIRVYSVCKWKYD